MKYQFYKDGELLYETDSKEDAIERIKNTTYPDIAFLVVEESISYQPSLWLQLNTPS